MSYVFSLWKVCPDSENLRFEESFGINNYEKQNSSLEDTLQSNLTLRDLSFIRVK